MTLARSGAVERWFSNSLELGGAVTSRMRYLTMGDDADNQEQDSPQVDLILFMFLGLCVGIVLEQVISRTTSSVVSNIPPTVCLFLVGLAMAGYSKAQLSDGFNESLNGWVRIDAQLMLFLFLPPLVFGEAMYLNWHHAKKVFPQAMTLAGPGVLLGSSFMAMFAKIILPYDWDWLVCLLFGSVLGATDTVAVLSIMNNAGASPKLTILIVGESLLNDGTSVVLFEACLTLLQAPDSMSIGEWIFFVIKMTIGSTLLGGLIGLFTVRWLRSVNRPLKEIDTTSQIAITLTVAYLTFFLAQHVFEISGLLALVAAAVMLSWLAPPIILNRETMHNIWSFVEWVGNTTIFLLAGLIIGHRVLGDVQGIDWMYMILLYMFCQLTRGMVVGMLYPVLKESGHKLAPNEAYFAVFAGLRGALGMALALIVVDESASIGLDTADANRFFFYIGGIVALSLLVNGSLARPMLDVLELGSNDSVQQVLIMDQIKRKLRHKMNKMVEKMEKELEIRPVDVLDVRMSCSILRPSLIEDVMNSHGLSHSGVDAHLEALQDITRSEAMHLSARLAQAHKRSMLAGGAGAGAAEDRPILTQHQQQQQQGASQGSLGSAVSSYKTKDDDDDDDDDNDDSSDRDSDYGDGDGDGDGEDESDLDSAVEDSWLNPAQIQAAANAANAGNTGTGGAGAAGGYSDNAVNNGINNNNNGGGTNTNTKTNTYGSERSSVRPGLESGYGSERSMNTDVSSEGVALTKGGLTAANADAGASGTGRGRSSTVGIVGGGMGGRAYTGGAPFSGGAQSRSRERERERERENINTNTRERTMSTGSEGQGQGGRNQRTWSVGSFLGTARGDRASRYSKGSVLGGEGGVAAASNSLFSNAEARLQRYSTMSTMLDPSKREGQNKKVMPEMLAYVRTVFLEIVRVKYWKLIEGGKLPRNCHSAQYLLYSVDVGIDEATYNPTKNRKASPIAAGEGVGAVGSPAWLAARLGSSTPVGSRSTSVASTSTQDGSGSTDGLKDWNCIEDDLDNTLVGRGVLVWWENFMPHWCGRGWASSLLSELEAEKESRVIYMLSAFIEAHEHAQKRIHSFVGPMTGEDAESGWNGGSPDRDRDRERTRTRSSAGMQDNGSDAGDKQRTPEELQVKAESISLVAKARERLDKIEEEVVAEIKAKQAAMTILTKETDMVRHMCEEGLLTHSHADQLLEEITADRQLLDEGRSLFQQRKREQANNRATQFSTGIGMEKESLFMDRAVSGGFDRQMGMGMGNSTGNGMGMGMGMGGSVREPLVRAGNMESDLR